MTTLFIALDFLVYSLTPYSFHFIVLAVPFMKSFWLTFTYFLILSLYEPRYLINLSIIYLLYRTNMSIDKKIGKNLLTFLIKMILFYSIYLSLLKLFKVIGM